MSDSLLALTLMLIFIGIGSGLIVLAIYSMGDKAGEDDAAKLADQPQGKRPEFGHSS